MKAETIDFSTDLVLARTERRISELMHWMKLRKRLDRAVRRQARLARAAEEVAPTGRIVASGAYHPSA